MDYLSISWLWQEKYPAPELALVLTLCILLFAYGFAFTGHLYSIPGPFPARFSRLWMAWHSWKGDMHREMIALHAQHGKLVRTGPNEISVSDLSAIKAIYGPGTKFTKSDWYSVWQGHRKFDLFAERNERIHGAQRRLVSSIYAMDSLKDSEQYVDDAVTRFVEIMRRSRQDQILDLGLFAQLFAFGQYSRRILRDI